MIEQPSGALVAGVGYSQSEGVLLNTSVTQDNFLGSGVKFGFSFNTSEADTAYGINYTNPYHTTDGISRGFNILYRARDAEELGVSDYTTDLFTGKLNYGFPISETNTLFFGIGFERLTLNPASTASDEIDDFVTEEGDKYN